jgi:hypothetical protein
MPVNLQMNKPPFSNIVAQENWFFARKGFEENQMKTVAEQDKRIRQSIKQQAEVSQRNLNNLNKRRFIM